ncbi:MAG: phage tail length tape measure family protein, partial [Blastocatellales bacterium]
MADNVEIRFGAVTDGSLTSVPKEAQAAVRSVSDSVSATAAAAKTGTRDISGLSTAMADIRSVSTSSAQALKQAGHSMEEVGGATAAVKRQMIVLAHEAISGNFSQMPGSFIVLAEQSKTLHAAMEAMFTALASPPIAALTAFSAVMGVIGIKAAEAAHFMHDLRVEMAATGNSYLFNPAEIERAIEGMKEFGYTESHAREAVAELRSAVRLHNNELQQAERLLPDLSAKMGSAANAAKFLKTAIDDPARALSALRAEMERNDPDALRLIDDMLRLGDTAGATRAELDYLTRSTRGLAEEGMTFLDKALQGTIALLGGQLPNAIRVAKESVEGFLGTLRMMSAGDLFRNTSAGNLIPYVRQAIEAKDLIQQARTGAEAGFSIVSTAAIETMKDMNVELARGDALTRQLKTDSSELLQWQDKLAAAQRALSAANATGDKNRAAEQTQNIAAIEARIGEVKRRAAEESLRDQLQTIDQEMDAHKAGSAERVRIARQELDLVRRTEGEKGSLYRETLNKLRAEQRAFTEEQRQSRIADLEGIRSLAEQDFGIQEQGIQLKRQLGQISATQEMQDLR